MTEEALNRRAAERASTRTAKGAGKRHLTAWAAAIVALLFLTLLWWPHTNDPDHESEASRPSDVQRGEYLTRIGNCISCHTRPGGDPFAGGVAFTTPYTFLGTLYSTNITPDRESGIGLWSEREFVRALREGKAPKHNLFPAFPYTSFTRISDEDARAIFAYLRTLKPVRYTPPENSPAFRLRWAMTVWNALVFEAGRFEPRRERSTEWNRGAYLVEGLGHCGACHTPRDTLLAERKKQALSGNTYREHTASGKETPWYAVNLTSAASGLGAWSVQDIAKYLKTGHSRRAGLFGPMNEVIIKSLQYLTEEDARAMAVYLKDLAPLGESPRGEHDAERMRAGASLYAAHCEKCHLASGRGAFLKAPPLAGSAVVQGSDPASLINVILRGARAGAGAPAPPGAWEDMKALGDVLDDDAVAAIGTYVRSSWSNRGGPVTADDVRRLR